jgi:hypothetical protein
VFKNGGMACFRGSCRLKDVPARKSKKPDQLLPVENNQQLLVPPTVSRVTGFRSNPIHFRLFHGTVLHFHSWFRTNDWLKKLLARINNIDDGRWTMDDAERLHKSNRCCSLLSWEWFSVPHTYSTWMRTLHMVCAQQSKEIRFGMANYPSTAIQYWDERMTTDDMNNSDTLGYLYWFIGTENASHTRMGVLTWLKYDCVVRRTHLRGNKQ